MLFYKYMMKCRKKQSIFGGVLGIFFPFLSRKGRALWAFALVERVAAGALKVPVPPTDALKTHTALAFPAKKLP